MIKQIYKIGLIIAIGVTIRLVAIPLFVKPPFGPVDVYYVDKEAALAILSFVNPYTQVYNVHEVLSQLFVYLPVIPIYYAPFYLMGDIRYGNILADVLIMLSVYWVAQSMEKKQSALYAPFAFAILPVSIWLTSVSSTNMMVGTAFVMLSLAAGLRKKYFAAAALLGIAVATNQFAILVVPVFVYYFLKSGKLSSIAVTALVSATIILPFLIAAPSQFIYDVLEYQFIRPLQSNGSFSLYSAVYILTGIGLSLWIRGCVFLISTVFVVGWIQRSVDRLTLPAGMLLLIGAFVLPIDGFWNYFLPSCAVGCALLPSILGFLHDKTKGVENLVATR